VSAAMYRDAIRKQLAAVADAADWALDLTRP